VFCSDIELGNGMSGNNSAIGNTAVTGLLTISVTVCPVTTLRYVTQLLPGWFNKPRVRHDSTLKMEAAGSSETLVSTRIQGAKADIGVKQ
jgi:hypothetical protein